MTKPTPVGAAAGCDKGRRTFFNMGLLRRPSQPAATPTGFCATLWILIFLLLSGCTSVPLPKHTPTLALPMQLHVQRREGDQRQDWLLVIQQEDAGLRWSLMDPLGIPQARQRLQDGRWHADGLLPPNPEARELFAALLFALTPQHELKRNYPQAKYVSNVRALPQRWQIQYDQPQVFRINMQGNLDYDISPLNTEAAP